MGGLVVMDGNGHLPAVNHRPYTAVDHPKRRPPVGRAANDAAAAVPSGRIIRAPRAWP